MSDTELTRSVKKGNIDAFSVLYKKHKDKMYNLALRMHRSPLDAEDSLQESFVKVFRGLGKFDEKSQFSTWLYKIVVNTCLSNLRKAKNKYELASGEDISGSLKYSKTEKPLLKTYLESAIKKLPEEIRIVFILYEINGLSHKEIAEILGIAAGSSRARLSQAKSELRNSLRDYKNIDNG